MKTVCFSETLVWIYTSPRGVTTQKGNCFEFVPVVNSAVNLSAWRKLWEVRLPDEPRQSCDLQGSSWRRPLLRAPPDRPCSSESPAPALDTRHTDRHATAP
jgi:hypothetical protein